jgi:hypothetical protein
MTVMDLDGGRQEWYDVEAELLDSDEAAGELVEAMLFHSKAGVKCKNLNKDEPCRTCKKQTGNSYYVWNLQLRVKRFE